MTAADHSPNDAVQSVREAYESTLSWRLTRPLRSLGTAIRPKTDREPWHDTGIPVSYQPADYDPWLVHFYADELDRIETGLAGAGASDRGSYRLFREIDDDLWAVLLTREYSRYPNIRVLLPDVPKPELQMMWNGAIGLELLNQSKDFYAKVKRMQAEHSAVALEDARVLDFGCGWGRLTRFFAKDVAPGALIGVDPVERILDVCRENRVPAELLECDFVPDTLPLEQPVDLAFSFSVFTHISERSHRACLEAVHASLNPNGLFMVTVRPPSYLDFDHLMAPVRAGLGPDIIAETSNSRYFFEPHPAEPGHPQYEGGDMTYGDTVVTLPYIREHWTDLFDIADISLLTGDMYQVAIVLKRREPAG